MSPTKPGILIIPGGFHVPSHYTFLSDALGQAGYSVTTVSLPSNGPSEPFVDITPDIEVVQKHIKYFIEQDMNVLLVMHSMGGHFGTEACKSFLPHSQSKGKGVVSLVYIASIVPDRGISIFPTDGAGPPPFIQVHGEPNTGVFMDWKAPGYDVRDIFYNDCARDVAEEAISKLVPFNESSCHHACTYPAWKEIESNYLICELDQSLPPEYQAMLAAQEGGMWKHVERIQAGHSPFLSKPEETARFIRKCAGEILD